MADPDRQREPGQLYTQVLSTEGLWSLNTPWGRGAEQFLPGKRGSEGRDEAGERK